ncbi:MAG: NPCBM/NEW2 domain-containing protein [Planctomycetota bacterium]
MKRIVLVGWIVLVAASAHSQDDESGIDDVARALIAADGLEVDVWARAPMLSNPTSIDVDERGRIWVAEAVDYRSFNNKDEEHAWREGGDRIVILEDTDRDGAADSSKVFVQDEDLVAPLGVAVIGDRVVVSCSPNLIVYTKDARDRVVSKEILLTGFGGFDHDHALHAVEASPDGRWLFNVGNAGPHRVTDRSGWTLHSGSWYTGGSPYNLHNTPGLRSDDHRVYTGGLALSVQPDGTGLQVLGHGFRNAVGTCSDSFGDVWMNDNDDTQSCRTTWLMRYGNCGFNSIYGDRSWQADRRPGQSIPDAHWRQDDPGVIPSGHVYGNGAPTGIVYYEGGELGDAFEGGLLLSCEAGQNVIWGYRRKAQGAGFALEPFSFLATTSKPDPDYVWSDRPEDRGKWFRPSDIAIGTDGTIYVADWFDAVVGGHQMDDTAGVGAIYRIRPKGQKPKSPAHEAQSIEGAIDLLLSPAVNVRNLGFRRLIAQGKRALAPVRRLLSSRNRFQRARAAWVLVRLGEAGRQEVTKLLEDPDLEMRVVALRALREKGDRPALARKLASDPSPAVRREVALSLRDVPWKEKRESLVEIASRYGGEDRWYLEALGTGAEGDEILLYRSLPNPDRAPLEWSDEVADIVWRLHTPASVRMLKRRAVAPSLSESKRRQAIDTLAFMSASAAATAMLEIAIEGPEDLAPYARWWVEHKSDQAWIHYDLVSKLPPPYPGEARFESPILNRDLPAVDVDIDLTGAKTLYLVVTDAGDGKSCDWVDWVEPTLYGEGTTITLSKQEWLSGVTGWGEIRVGANCEGGPLIVGGHRYQDGIGGHAPLALVFDIADLGVSRFRTRVGIDEGGLTQPGYRPTVQAFVYHDGPSELDLALLAKSTLQSEKASDAEREAAATTLAMTSAGGKILIALANQGALSEGLKKTIGGEIFRNPDLSVRALASRHFPREGSSLPPADELLAIRGDADAGRAVFYGERAACSRCHAIDGQGQAVGPDLSKIGGKFDRRALLDAILNPSASILVGFETHTLETEDGRILIGQIVADGEVVVVRESSGSQTSVPRGEIVFRGLNELSLMPDNVALGLTADELMDLVAFLATRR